MRFFFESMRVVVCLAMCASAIAQQQRDTHVGERQVLPPTLVPEHYELSIVPDAEALTFTGKVAISGVAKLSGRQIILNAKGLAFDQVDLDHIPASDVTFDAKLDRATIAFAVPFKPGRHVLHISFHAKITRGTEGFFAMDYNSALGQRRTLATNFEPAGARELLPCWDEPSLKASFSVTVDVPADRLAVSNMPIADRAFLVGGNTRVHFAPTPRMSTYLLFLGIGDFERIQREVDGVNVGVIFKRGDAAKASYALDQADQILQFYNQYFGVHFPLPKLDLVAAPGAIAGGSMENWGAIFFSQDQILFDPANSAEDERQWAFIVIAHEMAHQWFGDLVTMEWWDNLWLNEGFARWMQTHVTDALHPEWETGLQAAHVFENGKRADAKVSTHPVLQPVNSVEQAIESFDSITYDKGAAVITMLEAYVGPDPFRAGVRRYMKAHAFGNTIDADLWTEVAAASGKPVLDIERDFTRQPGLPLIRVELTGSGCRLSESRFVEDPNSAGGASTAKWRIPLNIATPDGARMNLVLRDPTNIASAVPLVNAGATAYARVAYPEAIAHALTERIGSLAPVDQLNLMNDAWALGQSGYGPPRNLLALIANLPVSADFAVWQRAVLLLEVIDDQFGPGPERAAYRSAALNIVGPLSARLSTRNANESSNTTILRSLIWGASAQFGDVAAVNRARQIYTTGEGTVTDRRTALEIVAAVADKTLFDMLLARARAATDPQEKIHILNAMATVTDPVLSARMVDIALSADTPAGEAGGLLYDIGRRNPDATWEALRTHLAAGPLPLDQSTRWFVIPEIASFSANPDRIADIRQYGEQDMPTDARRPVEEAVSAIKLNQRVKAYALPDISAWVASRPLP